MKILLDDCVPRKFGGMFVQHECFTVPEVGLAGKTNGELLSSAEDQGFRVFLTLDKGIAYQQNLRGRKIAIIIIRATSNRLLDLLPHAEACLMHLNFMVPGEAVIVQP